VGMSLSPLENMYQMHVLNFVLQMILMHHDTDSICCLPGRW
jgi:hypothetical protein